ncbi:MAG: helix-turn-helix domain-containing protein [Anaerovoracaceae bacterium]|jgi:putative transcriptional regulator|nr:helix-turn-helix transcriptional regulator [Clostridiales bacterium]
MKVTYKKLWKLLIDRNMKKVDLLELARISTSTLAKLGKDEYVSMDALVKISTALNVDIGDIVSLECNIAEGDN